MAFTFSEQFNEVAAAFAKSQLAFKPIKKNRKVKVQTKQGGAYTFEYADLGAILDMARPILASNGIAVTQNARIQRIDTGAPYIVVDTMLIHESGQYIIYDPLEFAADGNIQANGGTITYLKRYALAAALGIATEEDDDGNAAANNDVQGDSSGKGGESKPKANPHKLASEKQVNLIIQQTKRVSDKHQVTETEVLQRLNTTYDELPKITSQRASEIITSLMEWAK